MIKRSYIYIFIVVAALWPGWHALRSAEGRGESQDDEIALRGVQLVANDCLMCHDRQIIYGRALTPAQWTATLDKMTGWGARVLPEERDELLAYLKTIRPVVERRLVGTVDKHAWDGRPVSGVTGGDADHGVKIYMQSCGSCHGTDARGGEPGNNLVEIPILMDEAAFVSVIATGRNRMPSFKGVVSDTDARNVLAWLRAQKYEPGDD